MILTRAQCTTLEGDEFRPVAAASLTLRRVLEPGDLRLGSPIDVGGSLWLAKSVGPLNFYFEASAAWFGQEDLSGLPRRPQRWSGVGGVEIRSPSWMSVTRQHLIASECVDALVGFSRPSHEFTVGFKGDLGGGVLLESEIFENLLNFYNSEDFRVHLGRSVR